jgi:hypothetical protein
MQRIRFSHIRAVVVVTLLGLALLGTLFGTSEPAEARRRAAVERGTCESLGGSYFGAEHGDFWNWEIVVSEGCELPDGRTIACDTRYDIGGRQTKQICDEW